VEAFGSTGGRASAMSNAAIAKNPSVWNSATRRRKGTGACGVLGVR
jgi:hypothetical protein